MCEEQNGAVEMSMIPPDGGAPTPIDQDGCETGIQVKCIGASPPVRDVLTVCRFEDVLDPVEGAPEAVTIVRLRGEQWGASQLEKLSELIRAIRRAAEWFRQFSTGLLILEMSDVKFAGAGIPNAVALARRLTRLQTTERVCR